MKKKYIVKTRDQYALVLFDENKKPVDYVTDNIINLPLDEYDINVIDVAQDENSATLNESKLVTRNIARAAVEYKQQRLAAYPTVGDQLDAAYKARQGDSTEQIAIDAQIGLVKTQYPKPGA